jgi:hypothetical protein
MWKITAKTGRGKVILKPHFVWGNQPVTGDEA